MNQAVKTGLIAGVATIVTKLGEIFIPEGGIATAVQLLSFLVFYAAPYVAVKRTRDHELDGQIEFKQGLKAGMMAGLIATIFICVFQFIHLCNADVYAELAKMKGAGMSTPDIMKALGNINTHNFLAYALQLAAFNLVLCFFITVMASLVLGKRGGMLNQQ